MPSASLRRMKVRFVGALCVTCLLPLAGCSSGGADESSGPPTTPSPTSFPVTSITVVGPLVNAKPGEMAQFHAMAMLSNGVAQTVTTRATWASTDPNVASVSASGTVNANAVGQADIRATFEGVTGSLRVTVAMPPPTPTTFSIAGTIREAGSNATVAGATVTVKGAPAFTLSNGEGRYVVTVATAGTFTLRATKAGYHAEEVPVVVSGNTSADVTMTKSGG